MMSNINEKIESGKLFGQKINGCEIVFNAPKANWKYFNMFCTGAFIKVKAPKGTDYSKLDNIMQRDGHGGWKIRRNEIKSIIPQLGGRVYLDVAASVAYMEA
jgi:hypothetical protein